ncbi:glycoside hydrolase family 15 protein [Alsobacter sp. KACC 23698]|uniref:Glycoside hydrolase family 15 protein n=1 Tax=Alsobacter sp. KACC 23698 TaxID=3149229 RepID=A0AAU7J9A7_9HYPH
MEAPGQPGIRPTWTSSAKDMVGTTLGTSRLWFTVGYGIVNEVYYPRVDSPQIRDLGFIVADGQGFWAEVKRSADYVLTTPGPGVPAVNIIHRHPRFELTLRIAPDPERDVLLIEASLTGDAGLKLYALLAPHLGGTGFDNTADVFMNRDGIVLCAEQGPFALALACVDPATQRDAWGKASAGYVGVSDGWQDFARHGAMTWTHERAGPGNVALMAEIQSPQAVLALGFGREKDAAATLAISALLQPFDTVWRRHVEDWEEWHARSVDPERCPGEFREALHVAAMVLRAHQDKTYPGAMVASLSIPWGSSTDDTGGYHLVWPRDLVESAGALLGFGALAEARNILRYLIATQNADGRWSQNQWLGGRPRWSGVQLDEIAFPVLLAYALAEVDALDGVVVEEMVRRALRFVVLNGPSTDQDRWEETPGVNAFTLAVAIAAMVCGSELAHLRHRRDMLLLADDWNAHIEDWLAASDPHLTARHGVSRYYVRSAPAAVIEDPAAIADPVPVRNHTGECLTPASTLISTDFLQLVRFGLRSPDDPVVRDTVLLVDAMLKAQTPSGPSWYRYNGDGYGEHEDGAPYDGVGRGRPWPLLTGERGHYALCAGDLEEAKRLLRAMMAMSGRCGMLPEQIWDGEPVARAGLRAGKPSGSAMPLVWAHAEFAKLALSLSRGRPIDRPEAVWLRYEGRRPVAERAHWTRKMPVGTMRAGQSLRFIFDEPTLMHWGLDGWTQPRDASSAPGLLGLHVVDVDPEALAGAERVDFSCQDVGTGRWIETDRRIRIERPS